MRVRARRALPVAEDQVVFVLDGLYLDAYDALEEGAEQLFAVADEEVALGDVVAARQTHEEADVDYVEAALDDDLRGEQVDECAVDEAADERVVAHCLCLTLAVEQVRLKQK